MQELSIPRGFHFDGSCLKPKLNSIHQIGVAGLAEGGAVVDKCVHLWDLRIIPNPRKKRVVHV